MRGWSYRVLLLACGYSHGNYQLFLCVLYVLAICRTPSSPKYLQFLIIPQIDLRNCICLPFHGIDPLYCSNCAYPRCIELKRFLGSSIVDNTIGAYYRLGLKPDRERILAEETCLKTSRLPTYGIYLKHHLFDDPTFLSLQMRCLLDEELIER